MSDQDDIQALVADAQAEEVFSFAEVAQGRGYPKDTVDLYLDETTAYEISKVIEKWALEIAQVEQEIRGEDNRDQIADLEAELAVIKADRDAELAPFRETLEKSKYTFHLQGISGDRRDELVIQARDEVKPEYDHNKNFITGQVEKQEKPSQERGKLIGTLIWAEHIVKIVDPAGRVDNAPGRNAASQIWNAPPSQIQKFQNAIDKLQVAAEAFEASTDDDFLASA